MLKNYLLIALRNLRRQPGYTFINIAGLAVGLAACLLLVRYIQDELAFDRFHAKADRTVRVVEARAAADQGDQHFVYTAGPMGPSLVETFPEVTQAVQMLGRWAIGRRTVSHGPNWFYEDGYLFTDPAFFDVFDFAWVAGDPEGALTEPLSVVLTEASARTYFGDEDPMGQILEMEQFGDLRVTGILRELPAASHLQFTMLISTATLATREGWQEWMTSWESDGFLTYLVLAEGATPEALEAKLPAFVDRLDAEEMADRHPYLQRLTDIHFGSGHITFDRNHARADRTYVYIFSAIAFFLVLIACINYMNLATARSMRRAREVGMRKVVGAARGQLIRQFLSESMLTATIALVLALVLAVLLLPAFNALTGKALTLNLAGNGALLALLAALVVTAGVAAGSYPAVYLSRFRPVLVLKGALRTAGADRLRRVLVVTQFTLSTVMIVATLVVYNQMRYVQTKNLGFNEEQLVVMDINDGGVRRDFETIKQAFNDVPSVQQVSVTSNVPGDWKNITQIEAAPDGGLETERITAHFLGVDEDFVPTFGVTLAEGRNFTRDRATDSLSVILNEAAARALGARLGEPIEVPGSSLFGRFEETTFRPRVIGIAEDFHFESLHETIGPLVIGYRTNPIDVIDYFTARIDGANLPTTIDALRAVGEQFDTEHPFEYNFLDTRLEDFYRSEQRVGALFGAAAALAVVIACLGLFGLAAFTAEQRTREIGVRKVLGASVPGIVALLAKDFLRLVAVALVLSAPIAYLAMDRWLNAFAYRIDISWPIFLLAGLTALGVALFAVSYQAVRAALTNPVRSLRHE